VRAAKNGDIIELLPGQHEAEISEDDENAHNGGGVSVSEARRSPFAAGAATTASDHAFLGLAVCW
jgi:hypothetical protein